MPRREHDQNENQFHDGDERDGNADGALHAAGSDSQGGEQIGDDHGPDWIEPREQGDDDAGVAEAGRQAVGQIVIDAGNFAEPGEPGERTAADEARQHDAVDRNAGIARSLRVLADRANAISEYGVAQDDREADGGERWRR